MSGTITAIICDRRGRRLRATLLGREPRSLTAWRAPSCVAAPTGRLPDSTCDTVVELTPARRATWAIVTRSAPGSVPDVVPAIEVLPSPSPVLHRSANGPRSSHRGRYRDSWARRLANRLASALRSCTPIDLRPAAGGSARAGGGRCCAEQVRTHDPDLRDDARAGSTER